MSLTVACIACPFVVMRHAKSASEVWLVADGAFFTWPMNQVVLRRIGAQLKVFYTVVISNLIFMVRLFSRCEITAKMMFEHQSVLHDVSAFCRVRMRWKFGANITRTVFVTLADFEFCAAFLRGGGLHGRPSMR